MGVSFGLVLRNLWGNEIIELEDQPVGTQLPEVAFGDLGQGETTDQTLWDIKHMNRDLSQPFVLFQINTINLHLNCSLVPNDLRMRMSEQMHDPFAYHDVPENLPTVGTVCQMLHHQI